MTLLKVCGITRLEDARYVVAAGATHLGFIQDTESPRYISPARAREIVDWVYGAEPVGVFVNETPDEINRICDAAGFRMAQLHGDESPADCEMVNVPVIKVISITDTTTRSDLESLSAHYADIATHLLFDTSRAIANRSAFDWSILQNADIPLPYFLAGGIGVANVAEAINSVAPAGIDISSGLESSPGVKDFDKVDAFMAVFNELQESDEQ